MTVNFHQEIRDLKEKLNECQNSLVNFKTSYRKMQDTIDVFHKSMYTEKEQIRLLIHTINEILTKLDLDIDKIDLEDVKRLKNIESLILIGSALNQIENNIEKILVDYKKIDMI